MIDFFSLELLENHSMLTNLNEEYLLKFISNPENKNGTSAELYRVMQNFGLKIKFNNSNSVYDLIDKFEWAGMYYE